MVFLIDYTGAYPTLKDLVARPFFADVKLNYPAPDPVRVFPFAAHTIKFIWTKISSTQFRSQLTSSPFPLAPYFSPSSSA